MVKRGGRLKAKTNEGEDGRQSRLQTSFVVVSRAGRRGLDLRQNAVGKSRSMR